MEQLSLIVDAAFSDGISSFFCYVIVGWLVIGALMLRRGSTAEHPVAVKFTALTPNALATLGVLGTFTGILIGLLNFDVTRIDESVPELLAGLKIAFTTSIFGIAAAIVFRLLRAFAPGRTGSDGVSADDIHAVLREIRDEAREASSRTTDQQKDLRRAISSDGDGSLLTQLIRLRTGMQDGQSQLIEEFRSFAAHMVENNQKAIVEALEAVIRDFNDNLTEQFGENFKELNAAVQALVSWQDKYRIHVEALEGRLTDAVAAIEVSRDALEAVRDEAEHIPEAIGRLEPVLAGIDTRTSALEAHLEGLAELRDKAIEAFPVIEQNLETITGRLTDSVEAAVAHSRETLEEGAKARADMAQAHEAMLKHAEEARERVSTELARTFEQMAEQASREFARHGELIETAANDARAAITKTLAEGGEKMNEQFTVFDEQMQQELTRAIELFGRNLASVSEKFVADYTPLTERLQNLVRVGQHA